MGDTDQLGGRLEVLQRKLEEMQIDIVPPKYSGERDWNKFLEDFYEYMNAKGLGEARCCQVLPACLRGEAKAIYKSLSADTKKTWKILCDSMAEKLKRVDSKSFYREQFAQRRQKDGESVATFGNEISFLASHAFPTTDGYSEQMVESQCIDRFLNGLRTELKSYLLRKTKPATLSEAMRQARDEEQLQQQLHLQQRADVAQIALEMRTMELEEKVKNLAEPAKVVNAINNAQLPPRRCYNCDKPGHIARYCRSGRGRNRGFNNRNRRDNRGNDRRGDRHNDHRRNYRSQSRPRERGPNADRRGGGRDTDRDNRSRSPSNSPERDEGDPGTSSRGGGDRRERRQNYRISSVTHRSPSPLLPLMLLAMVVGAVTAQYQICNPINVNFLTERPKEENCTIPASEKPRKIEGLTFYIPVAMPEFVDGYHCHNRTTTTCTYRSWLVSKGVLNQTNTRTAITAQECWRMAKEKKAPGDMDVVTLSEVEMGTTLHQEPKYPWSGEQCTSFSNYYIQKGRVGIRFGIKLISELEDLTNCEPRGSKCQRSNGITVWNELPPEYYCTHREVAEKYTGMLSEQRLLIESTRIGLYFASDQSINYNRTCVPLGVKKLDGDAFVMIPEKKSPIQRRSAGPKRSRRVLDPSEIAADEGRPAARWVEETDPTPQHDAELAIIPQRESDLLTTPPESDPTTPTPWTLHLSQSEFDRMRGGSHNRRDAPEGAHTTSSAVILHTTQVPSSATKSPFSESPTPHPNATPTPLTSTTTTVSPLWPSTTNMPPTSPPSNRRPPTEFPSQATSTLNTSISTVSAKSARSLGGMQTGGDSTVIIEVDERLIGISQEDVNWLLSPTASKEERSRRDSELLGSSGDLSQMNANAMLNYVTAKLQEFDKARYDDMWTQTCQVFNQHVAAVNAWMSEPDPTKGVRIWFERDDLIGTHRGEAIAVGICTQITPLETHWTRQVGQKCYQLTPVTVKNIEGNNKTMFIKAGTRDLVTNSDEIDCAKARASPAIWRDSAGEWRGMEGPLKFLTKRSKLQYRNFQNPLVFNAPSFYGSSVAGLEAEVTQLRGHMHRISRRSLEQVNMAQIPSSGDAVSDIFRLSHELASNVSTQLEEKVAGIWNALFSPKVIIVICAIAVPITLALFGFYVYPMIQPALAFINWKPPQRPTELPLTVASVLPSAPPGEQEEPVFLLDYYPRVCHINQPSNSVGKFGRKILYDIELNNTRVTAYHDPGASITYCRESLARSVGLKFVEARQENLRCANQSRLDIIGVAKAKITVGTVTVDFDLRISRDEDCPGQILIGTDLMEEIEPDGFISMSFGKRAIKFGDGPAIPFVSAIEGEAEVPPVKVHILKTVKLPPRSDNIVLAKTTEKLLPHQACLVIECAHSYDFLGVGKVVVTPDKNGIFPIRLWNGGNSRLKVYKGSHVANLELIDDSTQIRKVRLQKFKPTTGPTAPNLETPIAVSEVHGSPDESSDETTVLSDGPENYISPEARWEDHLPEMPRKDDTPLSAKAKLEGCVFSATAIKRLKRIIDRNWNAFVGADGVIGCYKGKIRHRIDLVPGAKPVRRRPYRLSPALKKEVHDQIIEMLKQRIVRRSHSNFASPIVMVMKRDGVSWRFAVDYRALNSITRKHSYILPLITDILDVAGGKKFYTIVDMASGFHQIPIEKSHQNRTAFITYLGLFEFCRMPFGVCGGPETFQRCMDEMRPHIRAAVLIYLDDIIIPGDEETVHLDDLDQFFGVIQKFGFKLKLEKCQFGQAEIKYLGFLISEKGYRVDPKNVETVEKFTKPKTVRELRSLLGALSYFRRFIRGFASVAAPLYQLLQKEDLHEWREEQQKALDELKHRLTTAPILAPPDFSRPFEIETDASAKGIGACLLQDQKDGKHPIAFISRSLNRHEARYHSLEQEALAVVWALKEYQPYIEGAKTTTVWTDNSGVCSLFRRRDLKGRLLRFQMVIQPFNVTLKHRSGKSNKLCDHLSRFPTTPDDVKVAVSAIEADEISLEEIREEQKADPTCRSIWDSKGYADFVVKNGLVYHQVEDDGEDLQIVVPYALREKITRHFHCPPLTGAHLGQEKTLQKLKPRVYWPGMTQDVKEFVKSCTSCQERKTASSQVCVEPLHPIAKPSQPFEQVHVDIMGPIPPTTDGHQYILVVVDSFSKYVVATPLRDQRARTVAKALVNDLICRFGVPRAISTDQGTNLMGTVFKELCTMCAVKHNFTTPYHQSANGQVERDNKTIADMLSHFVNSAGNDWSEFLQCVCFAYNTAVNSTTKETPFYLNHGKDASLPLDVLTQRRRQPLTISDFRNTLSTNLSRAWESARLCIEQAQKVQKEHYDERRQSKEHELSVGDLVLKYREVAPTGQQHKFYRHWNGPFRIVQLKRPNAIIVAANGSERPREVHLNKLKRFFEPKVMPLRREVRLDVEETDDPEEVFIDFATNTNTDTNAETMDKPGWSLTRDRVPRKRMSRVDPYAKWH